MYRANLYLHPHTHHKTSTVPGAYPTATVKGSGSTDFTRTIQLTTDKPTQAIGRSSRNEAKGLFAAPSNGFFESPVMSRAHAEVRMVLEPHRKIVIQDTKSMHGTYVNGLQLHLNETAELQQGTEVTFGAEVTRGDDVYPAKTFRCEVEWERMRSPSPRLDTVDSKSRTGYGLSSAELEYESNLEDEDFDAEMDDHSQDERSASSGDSSPLRSPSREKSSSASGLTAYLRREEIAESHERSTRESLKQLNKVFEAKSSKIKDLIDRDSQMIDLRNSEERTNKQEDNTRPRMPTIHSLVNKTQSEQSKSLKVVNLVDLVGEDNDDEVEIIEKPASFNTSVTPIRAAVESSKESKTICIDIDDNESEDEDPQYLVDDDDNEDGDLDDEDEDDMESDIEETGSVSENEDEDHHMEEEESDTSVNNETKSTPAPENKEACASATKTNEPGTVPSSEPSSPPDVMSSKRINVWAGFPVREAPSVLPPIGRLPPSPSTAPVPVRLNPQQQLQHLQQLQQLQQQQPYQRNMAGASRWAPNSRSSNPHVDGILANFMDSKREFFDARAKNFARVSAELNLGTDHTTAHPVLYPRAQWTDPELHQCTPLRPVPEWYLKSETGNSLLSASVPKADDSTPKGQTTTTEESPFSRPVKTVKFWDKKKESIGIVETKVQEVENDKEKNEEEDAGTASAKSGADTDICDEDGDYDDEGDYEVGDYYCELESEDEDVGISDELDDIFDDEPTTPKTPTTKTQGDGNSKTGYSKFSIDDMMNHESPKGKTRTLEAAVLASPPPSESSPDVCDALEKSKAVPALEDILNPAAPSTPPPTLKRKRSGINAPISSPTPTAPPMIVDQGSSDAPEVVDTTTVADYPELAVGDAQAVEQTAEVSEDRPAKRVKSEKGGRGIVGLATAAMAGAVVGGIGMFAALVASAQ